MSTLLALVVLMALAAPGVAALRRGRGRLGLDPLETVAFGAPLGMVVSSLVLLLIADAFGFNPLAVWLVALAALLLATWLAADDLRRVASVGAVRRALRPTLSLVPLAVIGAFALRWVALWDGALTYGPDGLFAGHVNIWGDWAQHIGDVSSFVSGDNFPPDHPRYAGLPYAYHYLASLTAAALVEVGMGVTQALTLHSFVGSVLLALGVYAFARRLTGDPRSAALGLTIFLLGGGFAWVVIARQMDGPGDLWTTLRDRPWDNGAVAAANYAWQNTYFASIAPQRAFLYGLPLCLLTFTLLHAALEARQDSRVRSERIGSAVTRAGVRSPLDALRALPSSAALPGFVAAGAVAGLLPFAHLGPLPLLAMVCLCLFALFPGWEWVAFGVVWVGLTVPQLLAMGEGGGDTLGSFRTQFGWIAVPDGALGWLWFWGKNVGLFLPLLVAGFCIPSLFTPVARRMLWAFMPVFVVANLFVFQPDPWDNVKLLIYWYLAGSIVVAATLVWLWRLPSAGFGRAVVRVGVGGAVASLVLSGLLLNLNQYEGHDRYLLLTQEELDLAAEVRATTPPDALFAVGVQHNHPVPMLSGRRVLMSYPGWLWPRGIESGAREGQLRAIYGLGPNTDALIGFFGIDYVVIGPWERANFGADPDAWRARYPVVAETANYAVFAVRPE